MLEFNWRYRVHKQSVQWHEFSVVWGTNIGAGSCGHKDKKLFSWDPVCDKGQEGPTHAHAAAAIRACCSCLRIGTTPSHSVMNQTLVYVLCSELCALQGSNLPDTKGNAIAADRHRTNTHRINIHHHVFTGNEYLYCSCTHAGADLLEPENLQTTPAVAGTRK